MFSADGSNCLHYAAINDRKGIVEILLRSGADPSIPNRAGILPVELAKTPAVRELFLRDRSAIFSPIVQTRMLLTDYIEQLHLGSPTAEAAPAPAAGQNTTDSAVVPVVAHSSSNSAIFNMSEALEQSTPPPSALRLEVEVDSVAPAATAAASPSRLPRHIDAGSDRCVSLSEFASDTNLTQTLFCCLLRVVLLRQLLPPAAAAGARKQPTVTLRLWVWRA